MNSNQVICTKCNADIRRSNRSNIVAAILALLLGQWGAHKFYNGSRFLGIVYLVTTIIGYAALILFTVLNQNAKITDQTYSLLLLAGMLPIAVVAIISFIEAITYLINKNKYSEKYNFTSTQEEDKKWFAWCDSVDFMVIVVVIGAVIGGAVAGMISGGDFGEVFAGLIIGIVIGVGIRVSIVEFIVLPALKWIISR
jgi:TM2 domain-containing membrane protein YozV